MSFLSEKEKEYPLFLNKDDVISVLSSLITEEAVVNSFYV